MTYNIVTMRVALSKQTARFTVLTGRKIVWAKTIPMQPPHNQEYEETEKLMKIEAFKRAHS